MTTEGRVAPSIPAYPTAAVAGEMRLSRLRWLATVVPAAAILAYETARHRLFDHVLGIPELYGNVITACLVLAMSYAFSSLIFGAVRRIQRDAVTETRKAAALASMVEERERLSRELHDGLAQVISYVLVRLDTVRNLVESGKHDAAVTELESLRGAVDEVNADVRESIAGLRSRVVERGLGPALQDYLEEFEERYGIRTELRLQASHPATSADVNLQLFRIVQEALTNVRKHAGATEVRVGVQAADERLLVLIADNGRGFDGGDIPERSLGLTSMSERAESLGGACQVDSTLGKGTLVTITVPVEDV